MASPARNLRLVDPGALLARTHDVGDGLRVRLRLARPTDARLVRRFIDELSEESRRRRFPGAVSEEHVRRFTFFDPRERLVLAACAQMGREQRLVGLADVTLHGTGVAELGVIVADEQQSHGIGTLLTEAIARLALRRGARHLKAEIHGDNEPMQRLMERLGKTVRTLEDDRTLIYTKLAP